MNLLRRAENAKRGCPAAVPALLCRTVILVVVLLFAVSAGCSREESVSRDSYLLGTVVNVKAYGPERGEVEEAVNAALEEMERVERELSCHRESSEVTGINERAGYAVSVSGETAGLIRDVLHLSRLTEGKFDPTVGALVRAWGFDTEKPHLAREDEIAKAMAGVGYENVEVKQLPGPRVRVPRGVIFDLDGVLKGYAADCAARVLREREVRGALVNAGQSSITVLGENPDGDPWRIGLVHPRKSRVYAAVRLKDGESLSTTGDYQKYFTHSGERYSHVIDPDTGWPAQTMRAVTVLAESALKADALSTGLFCMPPEEAIARADGWPGVEVILMTASGQVMFSQGMEDRAEILE